MSYKILIQSGGALNSTHSKSVNVIGLSVTLERLENQCSPIDMATEM